MGEAGHPQSGDGKQVPWPKVWPRHTATPDKRMPTVNLGLFSANPDESRKDNSGAARVYEIRIPSIEDVFASLLTLPFPDQYGIFLRNDGFVPWRGFDR